MPRVPIDMLRTNITGLGKWHLQWTEAALRGEREAVGQACRHRRLPLRRSRPSGAIPVHALHGPSREALNDPRGAPAEQGGSPGRTAR